MMQNDKLSKFNRFKITSFILCGLAISLISISFIYYSTFALDKKFKNVSVNVDEKIPPSVEPNPLYKLKENQDTYSIYFTQNGYIYKSVSKDIEPARVSPYEGRILRLYLSPNNKHVAYYEMLESGSEILNILNIETDQVTRIASFSGVYSNIEDLEWSPDGKFLALQANLEALNDDSTEILKRIDIYSMDDLTLEFEKEVISNEEFLPSSLTTQNDISALSWHPNSQQFAYVLDGRIVVSDLDGKTIGEFGDNAISTVTGHRGRWTQKPLWIDSDRILFSRAVNGSPQMAIIDSKNNQLYESLLDNFFFSTGFNTAIKTKHGGVLVSDKGVPILQDYNGRLNIFDNGNAFYTYAFPDNPNNEITLYLDVKDLSKHKKCILDNKVPVGYIDDANLPTRNDSVSFYKDLDGYHILLSESFSDLYLLHTSDCLLDKVFDNKTDYETNNAIIVHN